MVISKPQTQTRPLLQRRPPLSGSPTMCRVTCPTCLSGRAPSPAVLLAVALYLPWAMVYKYFGIKIRHQPPSISANSERVSDFFLCQRKQPSQTDDSIVLQLCNRTSQYCTPLAQTFPTTDLVERSLRNSTLISVIARTTCLPNLNGMAEFS